MEGIETKDKLLVLMEDEENMEDELEKIRQETEMELEEIEKEMRQEKKEEIEKKIRQKIEMELKEIEKETERNLEEELKRKIEQNLEEELAEENEVDELLLEKAFEENKIDLVLLKHLADEYFSFNKILDTGYSPLTKSIINKDLKAIDILLNSGTDINLKDNFKYPIDYIISLDDENVSIEILKKFKKLFPTELRFVSHLSYPFDEDSPSFKALKENKIKILDYLLNNGFDVNEKNKSDQTLLIYASGRNNDILVLSLLVNYGVEINYIDSYSASALDYAIKNKNYPNIEYLVGKKANLNSGYLKVPFLQYAIYLDDVRMAKIFLDGGADLFKKTDNVKDYLYDMAKSNKMRNLLLTYYDKKLKLSERRKEKEIKVDRKLHPSRQLFNLSGPYYFSFRPELFGKRILLIGEAHRKKDLCFDSQISYNMADWLYDLYLNSPECLDIMVETDYDIKHRFTKGYPEMLTGSVSYNSPINEIRDKFFDCQVKKNCKNLRYHYIDLRTINENVWNMFSLTSSFYERKNVDRLNRLGLWTESSNNIKKLDIDYGGKAGPKAVKIYNYLMGLDTSKEVEKLFYKYSEELAKVYMIEYKEKEHKKYINDLHYVLRKEMDKMDKKINKVLFFQNIIEAEIMGENSATIGDVLYILPMDIFAMVRLFINFDLNKMERGPVGCRSDEFESMKNVIIYGGAAHIEVYDIFLTLQFGINPTIFINNDKLENNHEFQCIKLEKPFDFFGKF